MRTHLGQFVLSPDTVDGRQANAEIVVVTFLSDGTAFVGHTSQPKPYLASLQKRFAGLSPMFVQVGSFRRTARKDTGQALARCVDHLIWQWRHKLSLVGASIVGRDCAVGTYVVSTPDQKAASGASETIFPWLERGARDLEPCAEISAWIQDCGLVPPEWGDHSSIFKRETVLAFVENERNEADREIQHFLAFVFGVHHISHHVDEMLSEGVMALHVKFDNQSSGEKAVRVKKSFRPQAQPCADGSVAEAHRPLDWREADIRALFDTVEAEDRSDDPRTIFSFAVALDSHYDRGSDLNSNAAFEVGNRLLAGAIPRSDILVLFDQENPKVPGRPGGSDVFDAWFIT